MTLLGIGPMELLIIIALALVVLGPNKLPEAARSIAKVVNEFRRVSQDVTTAVTREMDLGATPAQTTVSAPALPKDVNVMQTITLNTVEKMTAAVESLAAAPAAEAAAPASAAEAVAPASGLEQEAGDSTASPSEDSVRHEQ